MSQEKTVVTVECLSAEFAYIFQILEEAHTLIMRQDRQARLYAVIAPLQMIIRNFSDLSDRIAKNGFAIKEGRVNRQYGGDRVSSILSNLHEVAWYSLHTNWIVSYAKEDGWDCFDRVTSIFDEASRRLDNLAHIIRYQFEPADDL